jgi:hypothetical protein
MRPAGIRGSGTGFCAPHGATSGTEGRAAELTRGWEGRMTRDRPDDPQQTLELSASALPKCGEPGTSHSSAPPPYPLLPSACQILSLV